MSARSASAAQGAAEAQARNVCINSMGSPEQPAAIEVRPIPQEQARLYLLERLQASMQSSRSKARGRLAAAHLGAVMRVQAEIDRLYDDLRAAGVALPDIVGPIFEVTGFALRHGLLRQPLARRCRHIRRRGVRPARL